MSLRPVEILLVEDNPGDVRLTTEALNESRLWSKLSVVNNGADAVEYLRRRGKYAGAARPDLILLDLNLPKLNGREVLAQVKADESLRSIPVLVLTTSEADEDVGAAYGLGANCYITKPADFDRYTDIVKAIENFWFGLVTLTPKDS